VYFGKIKKLKRGNGFSSATQTPQIFSFLKDELPENFIPILRIQIHSFSTIPQLRNPGKITCINQNTFPPNFYLRTIL
jgi:hypothetical protein